MKEKVFGAVHEVHAEGYPGVLQRVWEKSRCSQQAWRGWKVLVKSSTIDIVRARYKVELESFSRQMMNICPTLSRSSVEAGLRELIVKSDSGSAQADWLIICGLTLSDNRTVDRTFAWESGFQAKNDHQANPLPGNWQGFFMLKKRKKKPDEQVDEKEDRVVLWRRY